MRQFYALVLCLVSLFACGDDGYGGSPQTCQLACEQAARCSGVPKGDCAASCRGPDPAPRLSKRYLDGVRRCLDAQGCNGAGGPGYYQSCAHDQALLLSPSKEANDLCRRASDDERLCGRSLQPASCLDDVKIFDDDVLRDARRCFDGPCANHSACVQSVFGPYPYYPFASY